jgi:hypothetical protein
MFVPVHERKRGAQLKPATAAQFFFATPLKCLTNSSEMATSRGCFS